MTEESTVEKTEEPHLTPKSEAEKEEPREELRSDIEEALEKQEYRSVSYPNGMVFGVRMNGIPNSKGVHLDMVHVLDLRRAAFGKSLLSLKSIVLETVNRGTRELLIDVGLDARLEDKSLMSPWGRVSFSSMRSSNGKSSSKVYTTKKVYVIVETTKPSINLEWLCDSTKILTPDEFSLALRSDTRSELPVISRVIDHDKWDSLARGVKYGWIGLLTVAMAVVGLVSLLMVLLLQSGTLLLPLAVAGTCGPIGSLLLLTSRRQVLAFRESLMREEAGMSKVGDEERIFNSVVENSELLHILGEVSFSVSPLMASAARSLEEADVNLAMQYLSSVLDECVRLAPEQEVQEDSDYAADPGLARFMGMFTTLGLHLSKEDEMELALAYTSVSNHQTEAVPLEQAIQMIGVLNYNLYSVGVLRLDVRDSIDNMLNRRSARETVRHLDEELARQEEEETPQSEDEEREDLLDEMSESQEEESAPEVEVVEEPGTEFGWHERKDQEKVEDYGWKRSDVPEQEEKGKERESETIEEPIEEASAEEPPVLKAETVEKVEEDIQTDLEDFKTAEDVMSQRTLDPLAHMTSPKKRRRRKRGKKREAA